MNRALVEQNEAIDKLISVADTPLTWEKARKILEKFGWDFERAAQSLLMESEVSVPSGGLYDSHVERDFRQDQAQAYSDGQKLKVSSEVPDKPVVLNFGRSNTADGDGPIRIRAEATHVLNVSVERAPGDDGKMYNSVRCKWLVNSGLPVTDIILFPQNAPEGCNPVSHKYADGESSLNGSVNFEHVERGLYDVRLYNKTYPKKPVCSNQDPIAVGPVAILSTEVHDGNAVRVSVSTQAPGGQSTAELQVKPRDWIGIFRADEKDNTVLYERGAYKYCSDLVDSSVDLRLPRAAGKYQLRYFDSESPSGVCCGVSDVIDYVPPDKMEALAYSTASSIMRIKWSCFSREPSNWFWIGLFSDAKTGDKAKRVTWNWCCKGKCNSTGEHGLLDLEMPQNIADIIHSRTPRHWELQDFELRFYVSNSELLFKVPLPVMPPEPSANPSLCGTLLAGSQ